MAMLVMLPEWDRISSGEGGISAASALTHINDVVYCMSVPIIENGSNLFAYVPNNFYVSEVSINKKVESQCFIIT